MSRIRWARQYGPLAFAGILGLLAPGCMGGEEDTAQSQNRTTGEQSGGQSGDQGAGQGNQQGGEQGSGQQGGEGEQGDLGIIQSDAEIAGVLRAFNLAEIKQSQPVCKGAMDAEVKSFAEDMITQHLEAFERQGMIYQQHGLQPAESARGTAFIDQMNGWGEGFSNAQGAELEEGYMEAQVEIHLLLLDLIDVYLLPAVQNEALRAELEAVRAATLDHLTRAQTIHCAMGGGHAQGGEEGGQGQGQVEGGEGQGQVEGGEQGQGQVEGGEGQGQVEGGEGQGQVEGGEGQGQVEGGEGQGQVEGGEGQVEGGEGQGQVEGGEGQGQVEGGEGQVEGGERGEGQVEGGERGEGQVEGGEEQGQQEQQPGQNEGQKG